MAQQSSCGAIHIERIASAAPKVMISVNVTETSKRLSKPLVLILPENFAPLQSQLSEAPAVYIQCQTEKLSTVDGLHSGYMDSKSKKPNHTGWAKCLFILVPAVELAPAT
jgi:hypothetical protein